MRTIHDIAVEIRNDWKKVYFGAVPYLDAMLELSTPATHEAVASANYYADTVTSVILYFLANAQTWRGETAKRIKTELKALTK